MLTINLSSFKFLEEKGYKNMAQGIIILTMGHSVNMNWYTILKAGQILIDYMCDQKFVIFERTMLL